MVEARAFDIDKTRFSKSDISTVVDEYEKIIQIRDGIREIFQLCEKKDIPIVIVSAGITDFIREILRRKGIDVSSNRVVICSNEMIFNKDGLLERFTSPVVHAESKGKIRSLRKDFFERYKDRTNVILMAEHLHFVIPKHHKNISIKNVHLDWFS